MKLKSSLKKIVAGLTIWQMVFVFAFPVAVAAAPVGVGPNPPNPLTPVNGAGVNGTLAFSQTWSDESASGAIQYRYQSCNNNPDIEICDQRYSATYNTPIKNTAAGQANAHFWWHVQAKDALNNWSIYGPAFEMWIDRNNPSDVAIVSPLNNSVVNRDVEISVTANDAYSGISKVEFYYDGPTLIGSDTDNSDGFYNINLDTTGLADGNYGITAVAYDKADNKLNSAVVNIAIDNTPPAAPTLIAPASGTVANPATSGTALSWNIVTDPHEPVFYMVEVWNGSSWIYQASTFSPLFSLASWGDSSFNWRIKACDAVGTSPNCSGPSEERSLILDSTAPMGIGTPVAKRTWNNALVTSPTKIENVYWQWTAPDSTIAGFSNYEWKLYRNSVLIDSGITLNTKVSRSLNTTGEGIYGFTVRANDKAGNYTGYVASSDLVYDNTPPAIPTLISPADDFYSNTQKPTLSWSAVGNANDYQFQICKDDPSLGACNAERLVTLSATSRTLSTKLLDGEYWWRVRARDAATNESAFSVARRIVIDTTVPTFTDIENEDEWFSASFDILFTGVDFAISGMKEAKYSMDGGLNWSDMVYDVADGKYHANVSVDGINTLQYKFVDNAGNMNSGSTTAKLDTYAPTSNVNGPLDEFTTTSRFDLTISAADNGVSLETLVKQLALPGFRVTGSGVDYVELWYRKDKTDPYQKYCANTLETERLIGGSQCEYKINDSGNVIVNLDTNGTGGDGFYEFYSIAVDNAGGREKAPSNVNDLAQLRGVVVDSVKPDASTTVDTKSPVIFLKGDNPVSVTRGATFVEPGWTVDSDIDSAGVVVTGSVDTANLGSYVLKYNGKDKAEHIATEVSRTVNVVPTSTAPLALTPPVGGTEATEGDVLGTTTEDTSKDLNLRDNLNRDVKGAESDNDKNNGNQNTAGIFFGLQWYWWIIIIAGLVGAYYFWFVLGKKRKDEK